MNTTAHMELTKISPPTFTSRKVQRSTSPLEAFDETLIGKAWLQAVPRQLRELNVLIVEPEAKELQTLTRQLTACGIDLASAAEGFAALRMAASRPPDVVIAPMTSATMGCQQLAEQLRRDFSDRSMLIIGLGPHAEELNNPTLAKPAIDLHLPVTVTSEIIETLVLLEWNRLDRLYDAVRPASELKCETAKSSRSTQRSSAVQRFQSLYPSLRRKV